MKTSRNNDKRALIVALALCAAIAVGVPLCRYALPEPEHCTLCEQRVWHEPGRVIPCVVAKGVEYKINGYSVSVETDGRLFGWTVSVTDKGCE